MRASAELLEPNVGHYTFVSTLSVYADVSKPTDEDSELDQLEDPAAEDVQKHYGALKAACEEVVAEVFAGRSLLVRAGLIVGPHDPTDRFTYWVTRAADGGDILAPGTPEDRVQFIDVRDLAEWIVRSADARVEGRFNAVGFEPPMTMGELLAACLQVGGQEARVVWVDDAFLLEQGVEEWMELPLWVASPELAGFHAVRRVPCGHGRADVSPGRDDRPRHARMGQVRRAATPEAGRPAPAGRHGPRARDRAPGGVEPRRLRLRLRGARVGYSRAPRGRARLLGNAAAEEARRRGRLAREGARRAAGVPAHGPGTRAGRRHDPVHGAPVGARAALPRRSPTSSPPQAASGSPTRSRPPARQPT